MTEFVGVKQFEVFRTKSVQRGMVKHVTDVAAASLDEVRWGCICMGSIGTCRKVKMVPKSQVASTGEEAN